MSRLATLVLSFSLLASGTGCRKTTAVAMTRPRANATAPSPTPAARPVIARERVDALLAAWLGAQNEGRFDAYEALYARRFDGVRRTRSRTIRLDRAGWIADRRRMFRRPMEVSASDVDVRTTQRTADVEFTQRWASGSYSDVGRKRMLLVEENGALRISIEEMLSARRPAPVEQGLGSPAWFTLSTTEGTYVVLGEAPATLAVGPARLASDSDRGPRIALRALSSTAPEAIRSIIGTPVVVEGGCRALVTELAVGAVVVPHFGIEQEWTGEDFDETTEARPASDATIAHDVFDLPQTHMLLAKLDRRCGGRLATREGARLRSLPPRTIEPDVRARILAAYEARPEVRKARADADRETDEIEEGQERLSVRVWDLADRTYVAVLTEWDEGGVPEQRTSLFTYADESLTPAAKDDLFGTLDLVDVEDDGTPELLVEETLGTRVLYRLRDTLQPITTAEVDFQDCLR